MLDFGTELQVVSFYLSVLTALADALIQFRFQLLTEFSIFLTCNGLDSASVYAIRISLHSALCRDHHVALPSELIVLTDLEWHPALFSHFLVHMSHFSLRASSYCQHK